MVYQQLKKHIDTKVRFTEDDFSLLKEYLKPIKLSKGSYLLVKGNICRFCYFVIKGCFCYYSESNTGERKLLEIVTENNWTCDFESYWSEIPSGCSLYASEESEVLIISKENLLAAFDKLPAFSLYYLNIMIDHRINHYKSLSILLHSSSETKYDYLLKTNPSIFNRIPLKFIASYIGLTAQSFSRIRKKISYPKNH